MLILNDELNDEVNYHKTTSRSTTFSFYLNLAAYSDAKLLLASMTL
jgi:hypothetical protein